MYFIKIVTLEILKCEEEFILGILLGLILLVFLSYKGYSIIWVAPLSALIVALFGFGFDGKALLNSYIINYMDSLASFTQAWFPLFFLGAIFGKLMDVTGSAKAVAQLLVKLIGAKRALLSVIVSCAVLTLLAVTKMTHKDSYNDIGMVTCVIPILALVATIILGMFGIV